MAYVTLLLLLLSFFFV